ncbi:MAG: hypothetical protein M1828_005047 [Chrysothrix sp. TS-e1954]|nr:MAG: hypothetical protein M1828_005047 [Chrysothrix sp. TS-e1954]
MMAAHDANPSGPSTTTYEDLTCLEVSLEGVDTCILAVQSLLSAPLYSQRRKLTSAIRHFWALVLEHAPPEIDQFVQPSDSAVFASCLTSIAVERFEIDKHANARDLAADLEQGKEVAYGEPRSFKVTFEFAENEWFEDRALEKKFWFRRARDGLTARVSEPVEIHWKQGKDLTDGLTSAAVELWQAQQKTHLLGVPISSGDSKETQAKKTKDFEDAVKGMPEYKKLTKKIEASTEGSQSFFTFFGYRGRWITQEESAEATKEENSKHEKMATEAAGRAARREAGNDDVQSHQENGDAVKDDTDDLDEDLSEIGDIATDVDIFPAGEELAIALADDVWPNAIKYFIEAQQDTELGAEFDDAQMESDFGSEEVEELVEAQPPGKKRKTDER